MGPTISTDPLDHEIAVGALSKIERAKHHVYSLNRQIDEFLTTDPFELRISQSEDPPQRLVYVQAKHAIPDHFALIVGDAVHNLRTALDHICYAMVGDKAKNPIAVGFPFAKAGGDSLEGAIATRQMHLAPKDVLDEIRKLEPHPGGNKYLNAVKILDERDKHHFILTVGIAISFTMPQMAIILGPEKVSHLPPGLHISTVGDLLVVLDEPDGTFDEKASFQPPFTVGLSDKEELGGMPIVPALRRMVEEVENAIVRIAMALAD